MTDLSLKQNIMSIAAFEDAVTGYFASAITAKQEQIRWTADQLNARLERISREYHDLIGVLEAELTLLQDQVNLMKLDITQHIIHTNTTETPDAN